MKAPVMNRKQAAAPARKRNTGNSFERGDSAWSCSIADAAVSTARQTPEETEAKREKHSVPAPALVVQEIIDPSSRDHRQGSKLRGQAMLRQRRDRRLGAIPE